MTDQEAALLAIAERLEALKIPYIVIGGILYYGVYYYFLKDKYSNDGSGGLYGSSSNSSGSLYNSGN